MLFMFEVKTNEAKRARSEYNVVVSEKEGEKEYANVWIAEREKQSRNEQAIWRERTPAVFDNLINSFT